MRLATWNLNKAFTKSDTRLPQWMWVDQDLKADVAVLTEAEVPKQGIPDGWTAVFKEGGIGPTRQWGTLVIARSGYELRDITDGVDGKDGFVLTHSRPGTVVVVDVVKNGKVLVTIVGVYAMTSDLDGKKRGNGWESSNEMLADLGPLFKSKRAKRLVLAGDLNLLPPDVPNEFYKQLCDVVLETEKERWELGYCCSCSSDQKCGHMWTHWNRSAPDRVQNIDYVFISKKMFTRLSSVSGGRRDYPGSDQFSDHAPIVVDLVL